MSERWQVYCQETTSECREGEDGASGQLEESGDGGGSRVPRRQKAVGRTEGSSEGWRSGVGPEEAANSFCLRILAMVAEKTPQRMWYTKDRVEHDA